MLSLTLSPIVDISNEEAMREVTNNETESETESCSLRHKSLLEINFELRSKNYSKRKQEFRALCNKISFYNSFVATGPDLKCQFSVIIMLLNLIC